MYSVEGIGLKALSTRNESAEDNLNLLSLPPEMSFKPTFLTIDPRREKVFYRNYSGIFVSQIANNS